MARMQQDDPPFCDLTQEYQKLSATDKLDCGAQFTIATIEANLALLRAENGQVKSTIRRDCYSVGVLEELVAESYNLGIASIAKPCDQARARADAWRRIGRN